MRVLGVVVAQARARARAVQEEEEAAEEVAEEAEAEGLCVVVVGRRTVAEGHQQSDRGLLKLL